MKRFIPYFSHIFLPLQKMIKKDTLFKWGEKEKEAFQIIKQAIVDSHSLSTPNFTNDFILYTFASDLSYATVLTQPDDKKIETPISFFISNFQGAELNYTRVKNKLLQFIKQSNIFTLFF